MPIPPGSWNITAGAQVGALTFAANTGPLSGTIFGVPFVGFFDEASQTLTMLSNPQVGSEGGFSDVLIMPLTVFQGTLFEFTPPGTSTVVSVLTGGFFVATGANPLVSTTWFAQNPQPTKTSKEGKDGGKDTKDHKDGKEGFGKEGFAEKLPEFQSNVPGSIGLAPSAPAAPTGLATGRSFIDAGDRPAVGEAALQEPRDGDTFGR
jgi:hypothetical protein